MRVHIISSLYVPFSSPLELAIPLSNELSHTTVILPVLAIRTCSV